MDLRHVDGRGRDGRRGVAPEGLENEGGRQSFRIDLLELVFGLEEQLAVGDRENFRDARQPGAAQKGLLQEAFPIRHANERLGVQLAGNGPQPRSRAPAENDRYEFQFNPQLLMQPLRLARWTRSRRGMPLSRRISIGNRIGQAGMV